MRTMVPKIGQAVWVLIAEAGEWNIERETVGYLGSDGFVVEGYQHKTITWWGYAECGDEWFPTLKEAKAFAESYSAAPLKWRHPFPGHYCADRVPARRNDL